MTGSSATIHPITPLLASAIMSTSAGLRPPSPRRIERRKTALVRTACAAAMIRLHDAPSARCDRHTTIARTLQMSQVPRWPGAATNRVADIRDGVRDAYHAGQQAQNGCE